jgi:ligand-binding SRPBCC domain-containing protein
LNVHRLQREQFVRRPPAEVFEFFAQARNLERITPPWLRFEVLTPEAIPMCAGTLIDYRLRLHGIPMRWTSRIEDWEREHLFVDRQVQGPYRLWHHRHEFVARDGGTIVRDVVHYGIPLGPVGELADALFVAQDLRRVFDFRMQAVAQVLG